MSRYSKTRYSKLHDYDDATTGRGKANKKIMGVCSGLANQFGWDIFTLRAIALIGLFLATLPTLAIYIILGAVFY